MAWSVVKSHDFTGTDGTYLQSIDADWTKISGQLGISNNQMTGISGLYSTAWCKLDGITISDNQAASIDLWSWDAAFLSSTDLYLRCDVGASGNSFIDGFGCRITTKAQIIRLDNQDPDAGFTLLDEVSNLFNYNDTIRFEVVGTDLAIYVNGSTTPSLTATDAGYSTGSAGVGTYDGPGFRTITDNLVIEQEVISTVAIINNSFSKNSSYGKIINMNSYNNTFQVVGQFW